MVEGVLRRQAGVISRAQALASGVSSATITRRLARGTWVRLLPRVYFAADHALTAEARLRAAGLWAGPNSTLCGVAAAWWHGLWAEPPNLGGDHDPPSSATRSAAGNSDVSSRSPAGG